MESSSMSPLTQGRELKLRLIVFYCPGSLRSPLTQGRELKLTVQEDLSNLVGRPSRRGVN